MNKKLSAFFVIGIPVLALASHAHAQTASQVTPPSLAPTTVPEGEAVVGAESTAADAPAGSENVFVQIVDVAIDGNPPVEALARLRARLVGKRVSVAEIFAAAAELEKALVRRGHILSRVVVPAQTLAGAEGGTTLQLYLVEGYIERIDTRTLPRRVRGRVDALLAPLVGRKDVTLAEIERRLTLASDVPGLTLSSTIGAGTQFGGTILIIEGRHQPISGFLTFDNLLSRDLGRISFGLGIDVNSVLGAGETIYLRASGLPNTGRGTSVIDATPRNRTLAAGLVLPLGNDGLSFTGEYIDARLSPRHDPALPGIASRFERLSMRVHYPLVRSRSLTLRSDLGLDVQRERVRIFDPLNLPLSEDRQRVLRGNADVFARLPGGGYLSGSVRVSIGLDILDARSASDASPILPLSRAGTDAAFQKMEFGLDAAQPLANNLTLGISGRAQSGFGQPMSNAEQFGIATPDGISPLPSGLIQGDSGYVLRGEVRAPVDLARIGTRLSPYLFGARGGVRLAQPTFFERRRTDASAYGVGARFALPRHITASAEYGYARVDRDPAGADRFTVSLVTRF